MGEKFIRKFTEEEKFEFVKEVLSSGSNILIAKKYDLNPGLLSKWVNNYRRYQQTLKPKVAIEKEIIPNYKKEYAKMKKELVDKDLEIQVLRDLLKKKTQR
jgi:transposase-like protein